MAYIVRFSIISLTFFTLLISCKKEVKPEVESTLIVTKDSLVFNNLESQSFDVYAKPSAALTLEIEDVPEWVHVSAEAGSYARSIVSVAPRFTLDTPRIYTGNLKLKTNFGEKTIPLKGFVGDNLAYILSDSIQIDYTSNTAVCSIANQGNIDISFTASSNSSYISLDRSSGSLLPGEQIFITAQLDSLDLATGTYETLIEVNINNQILDSCLITIERYTETKQELPSPIIDARFHAELNQLITVSSNPNVISFYDTSGTIVQEINLNYTPTCLSINTVGTKAVVGHDGYLSYVDITNGVVTSTIPMNIRVFDIEISETDWAYAVPTTGLYTYLKCIDLNSENIVNHVDSNLIVSKSAIAIIPNQNSIYLTSNQIVNPYFEKLDISDGIAKYVYNSSDKSIPSTNGNLWVSSNKTQLYTASKNIFSATNNVNYDMNPIGQFNMDMHIGRNNVIKHAFNHFYANKIYLVISGQSSNHANLPHIFVQNASSFGLISRIELEKYHGINAIGNPDLIDANPQFVFADNDHHKLFIITKGAEGSVANKWSLETIDM